MEPKEEIYEIIGGFSRGDKVAILQGLRAFKELKIASAEDIGAHVIIFIITLLNATIEISGYDRQYIEGLLHDLERK